MASKRQNLAFEKKLEQFAQKLADGESRVDAYASAFKEGSTRESTRAMACNTIRHHPEVLDRVRELQAQAEEGAVLDRQARQALLTRFATDEDVSNSDRLSAIDKLNKMSGDYSETIRNEISGTLNVKEERRNIISSLLKECGIDSNSEPGQGEG